MSSSDDRLSRMCVKVTDHNMLNALNTCRVGHPWGQGNMFKWRNAHAMAVHHASTWGLGLDPDDRTWLAEKASQESYDFPPIIPLPGSTTTL